jgi:hypothetical protein
MNKGIIPMKYKLRPIEISALQMTSHGTLESGGTNTEFADTDWLVQWPTGELEFTQTPNSGH